MKTLSPVLAIALLAASHSPLHAATADAGAPFGMLPLVDEVICGDANDPHPVIEAPAGCSKVETLLDKPCRTLPNVGKEKIFGYRIGKGKGLQPGQAYLLTVEFPDDVPRSFFVQNASCDMRRGLHTGPTLGDVLHSYTNNNACSLKVPQSGKYQTWQSLFFLFDRYTDTTIHRGVGERPMLPKDGITVVIAQSTQKNAPMSKGAAVSRIRLFHVPDPAKYDAKINYPPDDLPKRYLFWREEMSGGAAPVKKGTPTNTGVVNAMDWFEFKAKKMKFLGMNTFSRHLLVFGTNQGWDAEKYGGNNWFWASGKPKRWQNILQMLGKYDFFVLPYYEYAGSCGMKGLGKKYRCTTLGGGVQYTHVKWCERYNADVMRPEILDDAKKMLDCTIVRHKDKAKFLGAWFRPRPSAMPISFGDFNLQLFGKEENNGKAPTRDALTKDKALLERYYTWWYQKRRVFLEGLRDYMRSEGIKDAIMMFTTDTSEPGISLRTQGKALVTDDVAAWKPLLQGEKVALTDIKTVERDELYLKALLGRRGTWGKWEWQHAAPRNDPENYRNAEGVMLTYSMTRHYTVSSAKAFDAFRSKSGLAVLRHYPLNENCMGAKSKALGGSGPTPLTGYFVSDMERVGPYCMMAEALAMANGDPRFMGYLASSRFSRGFPTYVRRFNQAFLALPALPSKRVDQACQDKEVVVRSIKTPEHGIYLAVINTSFQPKTKVRIALPRGQSLTDAATGQALQGKGGLTIDMDPFEMRALHVK